MANVIHVKDAIRIYSNWVVWVGSIRLQIVLRKRYLLHLVWH